MQRVTLSPKLESVTVYNDSAQLSFSALLPLEPATTVTVVLENMDQYGSVDWSTLQLGLDDKTDPAVASAILLGNINPIHETVIEDVRADVQCVKDEIHAIESEREICTDEMTVLNESLEYLDKLRNYVSRNAFVTKDNNDANTMKYFQGYLQNPTGWGSMGTFLASRKATNERKLASQRKELQKIEERLEAAQRRLKDMGDDLGLRSHKKSTLEATLVVGESVPATTKLRLEISCVVSGAKWSPLYDLRVDYAKSMLDVFYYANVQQCTSVDWEKVRMRLSTATPHTGGSPPPLWPVWKISLNPLHKPFANFNASCHSTALCFAASAQCKRSFPVAPMLEQAAVEDSGSSSSATVYRIPGLVTVRHNNVAVKVTVAHERFPAKLQFVSIPKHDPLTHFIATVVNSTDYEFIAGPSKVFYDNTFVNQSQLGNVSPGEEFDVSLGTDDAVTVNRKLVKRGESDASGFSFGKKSQLEFHYAYEVKCKALTTEKPVTVVVKDNYPVSDDAEVQVSLKEPVLTNGNEPSSVENATVSMDENTHEIVWSFPMRKLEKKLFNMVFTAIYPEQKKTFGLE